MNHSLLIGLLQSLSFSQVLGQKAVHKAEQGRLSSNRPNNVGTIFLPKESDTSWGFSKPSLI